jgi:hypothetical protein
MPAAFGRLSGEQSSRQKPAGSSERDRPRFDAWQRRRPPILPPISRSGTHACMPLSFDTFITECCCATGFTYLRMGRSLPGLLYCQRQPATVGNITICTGPSSYTEARNAAPPYIDALPALSKDQTGQAAPPAARRPLQIDGPMPSVTLVLKESSGGRSDAMRAQGGLPTSLERTVPSSWIWTHTLRCTRSRPANSFCSSIHS